MNEIKTIKEKELHTDRLNQVRDVFLFCCLTGFRYSDVKELTKHDIHINTDGSKSIIKKIKKTKGTVRIPLIKTALEIINKEYPDYRKLAEVPLKVLEAVKDDLTITQYKRASYVIEEQARTIRAADAIQKGKIKLFGKLMYASHEGLSNKYDVSCDELDFMVDFSKDYPEVVGSRLMGGGFGGCTINLLEQQNIDDFKTNTKHKFLETFGKPCTIYDVNISKGTHLIKI